VLSFLVSFLIGISLANLRDTLEMDKRSSRPHERTPSQTTTGPLAAFASCASLRGESSGAQEHLPEECETHDNGHPYRHRQDACRAEVLLRPHKEGGPPAQPQHGWNPGLWRSRRRCSCRPLPAGGTSSPVLTALGPGRIWSSCGGHSSTLGP
jgi:hypothetical protein